MKKRIFAIILALVLCVLPAFAAKANVSSQTKIVDGAGLLSKSDFDKVEAKLEKVSSKWNVDVAVITTKENQTGDINAFGEAAITSFSGDIVAFVVDMQNRDWAVISKAGASNAFTKYGKQYLGEQVAELMSAGKYSKAFTKFADMADDYINEATRSGPYDEGKLPKDFNWIVAIVIAIVVGLIAGAIRSAILNGELKSVALKTEASDCIKEGSFVLTSQREIFLTRKIERKLVVQNNQNTGAQPTRSAGSGASGTTGKF